MALIASLAANLFVLEQTGRLVQLRGTRFFRTVVGSLDLQIQEGKVQTVNRLASAVRIVEARQSPPAWHFSPTVLKQFHNTSIALNNGDGGKREGALDQRLLSAAALGDYNKVVEVLSEGASPHSLFPEGTALHLAALQGNERIVDLMLRLKVDVQARTSIGSTALMCGASGGHMRVVKRLIGGGARLDSRDNQGRTVLSYALSGHHTALFELLLDNGMDVNENASDASKKMSYLHIASGMGLVDIVKLLLKNNIDVNKQDALGHTALHFAASSGHAQVVQMLLEAGADKTLKRQDGRDAASVARAVENYDVLDVLDPGGAHTLVRSAPSSSASSEYNSTLFQAVFEADAKRVQWLIKEGADVNGRASESFRGMTPLQLACSLGSLDMIRLLLDHRADPNVQGQLCGPLHEAVLASDVAPDTQMNMLRLLLDHGADVNLRSKNMSRSALHLLCHDSRKPQGVPQKMAQALIEKGADVGCVDALGISAVEYALFQPGGVSGIYLAKILTDAGAQDPGQGNRDAMMEHAVKLFQDTALKAGLQADSDQMKHYVMRALAKVDIRVRLFNYIQEHSLWEKVDSATLDKLLQGMENPPPEQQQGKKQT